MEVAVKLPDGVEYPPRPVDTGHSYFCTPSIETVILCLALLMLMRMAEPALLAPGSALDCELGSDSIFVAVELLGALGAAVSERASGMAGLELGGAPVNSDWARTSEVPVLLESEPLCALAGEASSTAKKATMTKPTKLRRFRGEPTELMPCPNCAY